MPYLKFLQLVDTVRQLPSYPAMDATEVQTLNALAQEWHIGNKVSVVQAMGMLPHVSPSSVHRRLKTLRAKDSFLSRRTNLTTASNTSSAPGCSAGTSRRWTGV